MEGKRKRVSKKSKRSWRKHTKVQDVEQYLEDRRREQVTGVPAAEKADQELFYVHNEVEEDNSVQTRKSKKRQLKPLKSESFLRPNPAIVGFPPQKRKKKNLKIVSKLSDDVSVDSSSEDEEYEKSVAYSSIKQQRERKLATQRKLRPPKSSVQVAMKDLWADSDIKSVSAPDDHYLMVTRQKPVKRPPALKGKPSALVSVETPHPGMSYNPSFIDHQSLLKAALVVEEQREREAEKLEKKLKLAELTHQEREQVWLDEMTEGILDDDGDNDGRQDKDVLSTELGGSDEVMVASKRPVRAEDRKTKKQRRKERERKEEENQKQSEKLKRVKMNEVYRLRSIKNEIAEEEEAISEKQSRRMEIESESQYRTKRLGRHLYEDPDLELQLSSEITGSLRSLKPEGNLVMDRFKSLQKRNIIEPRERVKPHRKYKLKVKEKRTARLPEESQLQYDV